MEVAVLEEQEVIHEQVEDVAVEVVADREVVSVEAALEAAQEEDSDRVQEADSTEDRECPHHPHQDIITDIMDADIEAVPAEVVSGQVSLHFLLL